MPFGKGVCNKSVAKINFVISGMKPKCPDSFLMLWRVNAV